MHNDGNDPESMAFPSSQTPKSDQQRTPSTQIGSFQIDDDNDDDGTAIRKQAFTKKHKLFMWFGIALMWTVFELDNAVRLISERPHLHQRHHVLPM